MHTASRSAQMHTAYLSRELSRVARGCAFALQALNALLRVTGLPECINVICSRASKMSLDEVFVLLRCSFASAFQAVSVTLMLPGIAGLRGINFFDLPAYLMEGVSRRLPLGVFARSTGQRLVRVRMHLVTAAAPLPAPSPPGGAHEVRSRTIERAVAAES